MTPMGSESRPPKGLQAKDKADKNFGWNGDKPKVETGIKMMMHDGDQQLLNPYGHSDSLWTMYSFRPVDRDAAWP